MLSLCIILCKLQWLNAVRVKETRLEILRESAEKGYLFGGVECPELGLGSFGISEAPERRRARAGCRCVREYQRLGGNRGD
jgi:hypothetical protein